MSRYRPGTLHHVAPALLYVLAVFYVGSMTTDPLGDVSFTWKDKLLHALAFAGMQLTLARALRFLWVDLSTSKVAVFSASMASAFGGLLELWQAALPHRSAEWLDWAADGLGAAVAGVWWWSRHRKES